jgi:predicted DNA-binding protein
MSSGSKLQRSERHRRPLEITLSPETLERLTVMSERLGEKKSRVIEALIDAAPLPKERS